MIVRPSCALLRIGGNNQLCSGVSDSWNTTMLRTDTVFLFVCFWLQIMLLVEEGNCRLGLILTEDSNDVL